MENSVFLNDFVKAIQHADLKFFIWHDIGSSINKPSQFTMQERVFCYEFYHQFRMIMEANMYKYGNLIFNGEIKKSEIDKLLEHTEESNKESDKESNKEPNKDSENKSKEYKYPDFVLHGGQDDDTHQECVIEVKTAERIKKNVAIGIGGDIDKLLKFVDENKLNYNTALFIAVNMDNKELKEQIEKIADKLTGRNANKIYFMATKSVRNDDCKLKYFTINELNIIDD